MFVLFDLLGGSPVVARIQLTRRMLDLLGYLRFLLPGLSKRIWTTPCVRGGVGFLLPFRYLKSQPMPAHFSFCFTNAVEMLSGANEQTVVDDRSGIDSWVAIRKHLVQ